MSFVYMENKISFVYIFDKRSLVYMLNKMALVYKEVQLSLSIQRTKDPLKILWFFTSKKLLGNIMTFPVCD